MHPHWQKLPSLNKEPPCPRCGGYGKHSSRDCTKRLEAKRVLRERVEALKKETW